MKNKYSIIGLMSGTSLDGLDIAHCIFELSNNKWSFKIKEAKTVKYSTEWEKRLSGLENVSAFEFASTHIEYGHLLGKLVYEFIIQNNITPDFISSHGHTIFHQPAKGITFQIGSGAAIAGTCRLPVVCDFRSLDVALSGQGAPLVPIGDRLLFSEYTYRLNLGGFANISFEQNNNTFAYDICPVNMTSNYLANQLGKNFDDNGEIAKSGIISQELLNELNELEFYTSSFPKSLGKEWFIQIFKPIIDRYSISTPDKLRTFTEHVAIQISRCLTSKASVYVTGGGTYNQFLINRLKAISNCEIIIPSNEIIEFKEALIFSFLGLLRWKEEVNCLKSVTGAQFDNIGGAIYKPFP